MKKSLLFAFFCLIILLLIFFVIKSGKKENKNNKINSLKISTIKQSRGRFKLIPLSGLATVSIGNSTTLNLVADSFGNSVTGYDLILNYDVKKISLKELKNLSENFNIYDQRKPGKLVITGILKPAIQTKNYLQNTALVGLTFETIGTGQTEVKINWENGSKKDSNLISDNNLDMLDSVQGTVINIGKKITLGKDQTVKLEDGTELTLISFTPAGQKCFDCISSAKISVVKNNQKKEFIFKIGGIAGLMINEFSEFNHGYYLDKINDNDVTITVYEK